MINSDIFKSHTADKDKVTEVDKGDYKVRIYKDHQGRTIGIHSTMDYWKVFQYDDAGNKIYERDSDGNWEKRRYDKRSNILQFSNSSGTFWHKNQP